MLLLCFAQWKKPTTNKSWIQQERWCILYVLSLYINIYIYLYIYIDNNHISKATVHIQVTTWMLDSLIFSFKRGLEMIWRCQTFECPRTRPGLMMIDCHPWNPWHGYFHCERHEIHHLWIPAGQRWWIWFPEWFQNLSKNFSWPPKHSNDFRNDASFGKWTNKTH